MNTAATEATTEIPVLIVDDGLVIDVGDRIDLLVEPCVVVELKTVRAPMSVHHAQLLSYLRSSKMPDWASHQFPRGSFARRH